MLAMPSIPTIIEDLFRAVGEDEPERLDEVTVKDLAQAISPSSLPHRDYLPFLKSVNYKGMRGDTMKFHVPSPPRRKRRKVSPYYVAPGYVYNGWNTYVRFNDWWTVLDDASLKPQEAGRLALWSSNVALHCHCPAFKYYGYQYILSQLDAAIVPEERFPHTRNPQLKNVACKHLRKVIPAVLFYSGTLAQQINLQRKKRG